jgi:hypothetical protein
MFLLFFARLVSLCLFRFAFEQVKEASERVSRSPVTVRLGANIWFGLSDLSRSFRGLHRIGWFGIIRAYVFVTRRDLCLGICWKTNRVHEFIISDRWI